MFCSSCVIAVTLQMLHIFKMHGCMCLIVDMQRPRTWHAVFSVSNLMVARSVHAFSVNLPSKAHAAAGG
jgi:hypothetical protein